MASQMDSLFYLAIAGEKLLTSWIEHDYGQYMSQRSINRGRFLANPIPRVAVTLRVGGDPEITLVLALLISDGGAG